MTTLPDLNTDGIGHLAYWNILDHGANSYNPTESLFSSRIESSERYENGFKGSFKQPGLKFRVKGDGWIVVYFDVVETTYSPLQILPHKDEEWNWYTNNVESWDLFDGPPENIQKNRLSVRIKELIQNVSSSYTFNYSDVGLYDAQNPNATQFTHKTTEFDPNYPTLRWAYDDISAKPEKMVCYVHKGEGSDTYYYGFVDPTDPSEFDMSDIITQEGQFYEIRTNDGVGMLVYE